MSAAVPGPDERDRLIAAATDAARQAYAPYSRFPVGAALLFADGAIIAAGNVENASYGLSLCAETVAVAKAFADGRRTGFRAAAVSGAGELTPCGRCRQVLHELASLDGADPPIWCAGGSAIREYRLSALLPHPFALR